MGCLPRLGPGHRGPARRDHPRTLGHRKPRPSCPGHHLRQGPQPGPNRPRTHSDGHPAKHRDRPDPHPPHRPEHRRGNPNPGPPRRTATRPNRSQTDHTSHSSINFELTLGGVPASSRFDQEAPRARTPPAVISCHPRRPDRHRRPPVALDPGPPHPCRCCPWQRAAICWTPGGAHAALARRRHRHAPAGLATGYQRGTATCTGDSGDRFTRHTCRAKFWPRIARSTRGRARTFALSTLPQGGSSAKSTVSPGDPEHRAVDHPSKS